MWLTTRVQHRTHLLKDCMIQAFRYTIMLRSVVHSEFLLSAFSFEMHDEFLSSVFSPTIQVKDANISPMLCLAVHFILPVCLEGVALVFQEVKVS